MILHDPSNLLGSPGGAEGSGSTSVYKLCERGRLPHYRTATNAVRFACGVLGRTLRLHRPLA